MKGLNYTPGLQQRRSRGERGLSSYEERCRALRRGFSSLPSSSAAFGGRAAAVFSSCEGINTSKPCWGAAASTISPVARAKYEGGRSAAFGRGDRHTSHHQPATGWIFEAQDKVKWHCADSHPSPKELHTPKELLMLCGCRSHLPPAPSAIGFAATPTLDANLFLAALLPAA